MSPRIKLLPDNISNQIAAGEVIQRPSSVVKELLENAVDAGAKNIQLIIKDAGKTLIQVIDNGSGIMNEDLNLAFVRHATSKIRKTADLYTLSTKGFRGEALASIAAISNIEAHTRTSKDEVSHYLKIEGGCFNYVSMINKIKDIGMVQSSYLVNLKRTKSKYNLIFE